VKISVLSFNLSDNATGRADLLARLLAPRYEVAVVGPQFGSAIWEPARGSPVQYRSVPAARGPGFARWIGRLLELIDGELIYASKPRPTSFGVGLLARLRRRRPLLLDIDDWEVGFYYQARGLRRLGRFLNLADPNGLLWTWLMERKVRRADGLTVASRFLADRFGGTLLPHVRDTEAWDPTRHDGAAVRAKLGVAGRKTVMFLGTPRGYKGVDDLVEAVGRLGGSVTVVLVGVNLESQDARRWAALPFVRLVGKIPFDEIPGYLMAADVVAVPQRATAATIGQVPAKLFDAMALGRPIVTTSVSMIPEILDGAGVLVPPGDVPALAAGLRRLLDDPATAAALGRRSRERCVAEYSFTAARARLFPLIEEVAARGSR
jgi:glycosyltransferase involved in cell wall biosynthesis